MWILGVVWWVWCGFLGVFFYQGANTTNRQHNTPTKQTNNQTKNKQERTRQDEDDGIMLKHRRAGMAEWNIFGKTWDHFGWIHCGSRGLKGFTRIVDFWKSRSFQGGLGERFGSSFGNVGVPI